MRHLCIVYIIQKSRKYYRDRVCFMMPPPYAPGVANVKRTLLRTWGLAVDVWVLLSNIGRKYGLSFAKISGRGSMCLKSFTL